MLFIMVGFISIIISLNVWGYVSIRACKIDERKIDKVIT